MNAALQRLLDAHHGVVAWSAACREISRGTLEWAVRTGAVLRPYSGVVVDPAGWGEAETRWRAALVVAGPSAALSHTTALAVWRLPVPEADEIHVTTGPGRRIRVPGIVGHRVVGFSLESLAARVRRGVVVVSLEWALVDSWPMLVADTQRAPLLCAVGDRLTTTARVRDAVSARVRLPQRAALLRLLERLDAGCRSPLELWGYDHVFTGPGFEQLRWQVPVALGSRTVWLDAYDEESVRTSSWMVRRTTRVLPTASGTSAGTLLWRPSASMRSGSRTPA